MPSTKRGLVRPKPATLTEALEAAAGAAAAHAYDSRKKVADALAALAEVVRNEAAAGTAAPAAPEATDDGRDKALVAGLKDALAAQDGDPPEVEEGTPEKVSLGPVGVLTLKALLHLFIDHAKRRRKSAGGAVPAEEDEA